MRTPAQTSEYLEGVRRQQILIRALNPLVEAPEWNGGFGAVKAYTRAKATKNTASINIHTENTYRLQAMFFTIETSKIMLIIGLLRQFSRSISEYRKISSVFLIAENPGRQPPQKIGGVENRYEDLSMQ